MYRLTVLGTFFIFLIISGKVFGQSGIPDSLQAPPKNWFALDPESDHVQGIGIEKAYALLLKGRPSKKVIVAVMDTGVDILHEDLKDNIWTNTDEIAGNGIDDDKNGYVDDIHGWNFIGGKNGDVEHDLVEVTREYMRLKPTYDGGNKLTKKEKKNLPYWEKVKSKYERDSKSNQKKLEEYEQQYNLYTGALYTISICDSIVRKIQQVDSVYLNDVEAMPESNDTLKMVKNTLLNVYKNLDKETNLTFFVSELENNVRSLFEYVDDLKAAVASYNLSNDPRSVVGDDPMNPFENKYGNNHINDPGKHGTHVAGIIAAKRNNNIGINGIADNVLIMPIRVVPASGDERDKDVANGILYAVNNGAQIINMSFGKSFSPNKDVVEKAIRYAELKNVLIVHASGNDSDDLDTKDHFPIPKYSNQKVANNWLEIGASSSGLGNNLVAEFSNYGKKTVDVFAPGTDIYSTTPNNSYESLQGTSMATPVVSGIAAVLLSYYPELTAVDVRDIIFQSSRTLDGLTVIKPGTSKEVEFKELSKSGGIVNAYNALLLASTWKKYIDRNK